MTTVSIDRPFVAPRGTRPEKPLLRWLAPVLLVVAAVGVAGIRMATQATPAVRRATAPAPRFVPLPTNPALEAAWGIRFTAVLIEADRGMIDLRYIVLDPAKSGRIHGKSTGAALDPSAQAANLPTFILESDGRKITPDAALMHFEHFHFQTEAVGNTFSIIYGNAGGLLHAGDRITIHMIDGLELPHVVVSS